MTKQMKLRRVTITLAWWEDYEGFDLTQEQITRRILDAFTPQLHAKNGPIVAYSGSETHEHEVSE
jgi:hypothetical protein